MLNTSKGIVCITELNLLPQALQVMYTKIESSQQQIDLTGTCSLLLCMFNSL